MHMSESAQRRQQLIHTHVAPYTSSSEHSGHPISNHGPSSPASASHAHQPDRQTLSSGMLFSINPWPHQPLHHVTRKVSKPAPTLRRHHILWSYHQMWLPQRTASASRGTKGASAAITSSSNHAMLTRSSARALQDYQTRLRRSERIELKTSAQQAKYFCVQ